MIRSIVKLITCFALLGCISNQVCYAEPAKNCRTNDCYIQLAQSGQDESSFIKKNQEAVKSSTNVALFTVYRIKCLNTSGKNGLIACNKALSVKPTDPTLRKRRAALSAQLTPKRPPVVVRRAPPVIRKPAQPRRPKVVQKSRPKVPPVVSKPRQKPVERKVDQATLRKENIAKKQRKDMTIEVQALLKKLGFNISVADGIAGKNTKKAIKSFLNISNIKISSKINKTLLSELNNAYKAHLRSNTKLASAKNQKEGGKLNKALEIIEDSLKITPWHNPLKTLKSQINEQIANTQKAEQEKAENDVALKKAEEQRIQEEERRIALQRSLKEAAEQKKFEKQLALKKIEEQKEFEKQHALKKAEEERQLEILTQQKQQQQNKSIISKAKNELLNNNFAISLQSINKGLQLSPSNKEMLKLRENILFTQKQYQRNEEIRIIVKEAQDMFDKKELKKAELLVMEGLIIDPSNQSLLLLNNTLSTGKERKHKISSLLLEARKLFAEGNFEDVIGVTSNGLLLDPTHIGLLEINQKAAEEIEKVMIRISLRKQKISNYLALIEGKQRELLNIEKSITSERKLLLIKAQETLEKYWLAEKLTQ